MKLEVNIEKRYAYILIGLLVLIGGFFVIGAAVDYPFSTIMPDYAFPINNEYLATSLAGIIGTIFTFLVLFTIGSILNKSLPK